MSLAQTLHQMWSADAELSALIPPERFCTGRVPPSEEMPYCRLELPGGSEIQRSRETFYEKRQIVFHVWSDTFDEGAAIAPQIRRVFASQEFDWETGGVTDCRPHGPPAARQTALPEIKAWETVVAFAAATWEQRQDG
jgi:Protein of unknown function (DUF3168)